RTQPPADRGQPAAQHLQRGPAADLQRSAATRSQPRADDDLLRRAAGHRRSAAGEPPRLATSRAAATDSRAGRIAMSTAPGLSHRQSAAGEPRAAAARGLTDWLIQEGRFLPDNDALFT